VKITSLIVDLSGGWLPAALLLTALACLILGMEVPTTAAYVICISVAGPALQQLGVPLLAAHLFVFWFALLSTITPPVCGTVFIAAGMAGAPWLKVAVHAMLLGVGLYLIPLAMMADLSLIALGESPAARPCCLFAHWCRAVPCQLGPHQPLARCARSRRKSVLRHAAAVCACADRKLAVSLTAFLRPTVPGPCG
jgi:TRAP-type uncharacterized transport system fused permease subunit